MRNRVANLIKQKAKEDKNLFLIAGDAGLGVWCDYKVEHPKQYINPGVNEACDVGMAAGMALRGHKVIFYNIAPFVVMRPYEQVRNDICYQNLPVILVGTGSGVTYAPAGMTHYVIEDIALCKTMPNLDIFSPADPIEAEACFEYAYTSKNPSYIRIPKAGEPELHSTKDIDITKPQKIKDGKDGVLFVHSSIVDQVDQIESILSKSNISLSVYTVPMLTSNFDYGTILADYDHVFTLEEHFVDGGFGSILAEYCNNNSIFKKINKYGIKNEYIHAIGNRNYMIEYYGCDGVSVADKIKDVING
jgi:transketolase